jgi:gamma-glutamylcyclotransferase (GGCT)/AIG2-like uncharacterized protein YtfP
MSRASVRLFVYGSLKRGGRHHEELASARFLGLAETEPGYRLEQLGEYLALLPPPAAPNETEPPLAAPNETVPPPAAPNETEPPTEPNENETETETAEPVRGELFEVDESLLPTLDTFEGAAYYRAEIPVSLVLQRQGEDRTQTRHEFRDRVFALAYLKKAR